METHQALCFLGLRDPCLASERGGDPFKTAADYKPQPGTKKAEIEFNQPNIQLLSEDEEMSMSFILSTQNETLRFYNKLELQEIMKTDLDTPTREDIDNDY